MRPLLKPALRRLWRDPATLQFGIDPAYAVVLSGIEVTDTSLLELLDGSRDLAELGAEAERRGHQRQRLEKLVETLESAAVLDEAGPKTQPDDARRQPDLLSLSLLHRAPGAAASTMSARNSANIDVLGAGRVGAAVAMLLTAAGVGQVDLSDTGPVRQADISPGGIRGLGSRQANRADAARSQLGLGQLSGRPHAVGLATARRQPGSIAVLAPTGSVVPPEWLAQVRHRPHLPVVIRETTAVIGPLVLPGRSPCLRCVELTRGDRDPAWPVLAAQLISRGHSVEPCDVALASAAASIAALHVLAWLDGGSNPPPPSIGGTVELSLADLRLRRRSVAPHPGCGCGAIDEPQSQP